MRIVPAPAGERSHGLPAHRAEYEGPRRDKHIDARLCAPPIWWSGQLVEQEGKTVLFRDACKNLIIASIGPTASERLKHYDLRVDFEPSHPKMGILVKEISEQVHALLSAKR